MASDDPNLDLALDALGGTAAGPADDDARWARRVASRVTTQPLLARDELAAILAPPFPDDFVDTEGEGVDHLAPGGHDPHDHDAVSAADDVHPDALRGWEGSMSEEESSRSSLAGLAGLTRSGPVSREPDGAAKGDDSGLIDLRGLGAAKEPEPAAPPPPASAPAPSAPAASAPVASAPAASAPASSGRLGNSKTLPAVPAAISASRIPAAPSEPAVASAAEVSSATAVAAATPSVTASAQPAQPAKKGGAGIWIALGGLAAAAAIAAVVVPMGRKDEAPSEAKATEAAEAKPAATASATAAPADEKVAQAEPKAADPAPEAPSEPAPEAPTAAAGGAPGAKAATGPIVAAKKEAVDPKAPAKDTKAAAPAAPTSDPIAKPQGGNLDDVLGLNKGEPVAKAKDPSADLPDKPDSMDVRSAINAKVSGATACVKGLDGASSVSISFGPSGSVSGVAVTSGPAKGTGAEACIKNAFSSAKVPPSKKGASGSASLHP